MEVAGPILGVLVTFLAWQFFIWPTFFKGVDRAVSWWSDKKFGRIYSSYSVDNKLGRVAEHAIAENRFRIVGADCGQRLVLIIKDEPELVCVVSRESSFSGGAPDIIIHAVYDPREDGAEALVERLVTTPVRS